MILHPKNTCEIIKSNKSVQEKCWHKMDIEKSIATKTLKCLEIKDVWALNGKSKCCLCT